MRAVRYHLLDVFTSQAFTGNPLAVFVDPGPLSDGQMQRIARELNLSETAFVWSPAPRQRTWRTRIFTPSTELPFAGHPSIGAAYLLAALGLLAPTDGRTVVVLEERSGPVEVVVALDSAGLPSDAELVAPQPSTPVTTASPAHLVAAVGLAADDLHATLPVAGYSAGVPFSIVPVADVDRLARAQVDTARWAVHVALSDAPSLYLVTPLDASASAPRQWRARMFAPGLGIIEDPATGAAAVAFGGYLDSLGPSIADEQTVEIEQGAEMGRPSLLRVRIQRGSDALPTVRVGGAAVLIGDGTLGVPRS